MALRTSWLILALASGLAAQRTWIVDGAGGAGVDFRDLPPAVSAAAPGDTILIRPYPIAYLATTITKGLRIQGAPGVTIENLPLVVSDLPASQRAVLHTIEVYYVGVDVTNCAGPVHLEGLKGAQGLFGPGVNVNGSARVTITSSQLAAGAGPGLNVQGSTVLVSGSTILGRDGNSSKYLSLPGLPGVSLASGTVVLGATNVRGGSAGGGFPATTALSVSGGEMLVGGGAAHLLDGRGTDAAVVTGGRLVVDPAIRLSGALSGSGSGVVLRSAAPALAASALRPGASWSVDLFAKAGEISGTLLGKPAAPLATPLGTLWLDASLFLVLDLGSVPALGQRTITLTVPNLPSLVGDTLVLQSVVGAAAPSLSTPAFPTGS